MLMVIFGAGASYDSFPSTPPPTNVTDYDERPPLASQLFAPRPRFRDMARLYPKCLPLIAELEPRSGSGVSVEGFLEQYQAQADGEARSQLWAIRYYLQEIIKHCESQWSSLTRGVSNYSSLFNQVRRSGHVCFVTFNYDTLFEQSLTQFDISFPSLGHYVSDPNCTVVKLHGSTDWSYWIRKRTTNILQNEPTPHDIIRAAPPIDPKTALLSKTDEAPRESVGERYFSVPALAIPVVSKSEFVCPGLHLDALRALLPNVTHLAAIGWKAAEKHFLTMLGEGLGKPVRVTAVCGNATESNEVLERIRAAGVSGSFDPISETFTDFVRRRLMDSFLK
jgi:hypothetical protein